MPARIRFLVLVLAVLLPGTPALAVSPVFDPGGGSFYDMPFPYELRRDADGTISLDGFPRPSGLVSLYLDAIEKTPGFGLGSGVFFKLDGELSTATLPPTSADTLAGSSSVFLIDIDPTSPRRGRRIPLWTNFRSVGDAYRDDHLLGLMPVPGHVLDPDTLYAAVLTDDLEDDGGGPLTPSPFLVRMQAETPLGGFEIESLDLFRKLWRQLENREGLSRDRVVGATVYRTGDPTAGLLATEKFIRHRPSPPVSNVTLSEFRSGPSFLTFTGQFSAPQFQVGTPPYAGAGGTFAFDQRGRPVVQRSDVLTFVLTIPNEAGLGPPMPGPGWPVVAYMHGTGGDRFTPVRNGVALLLAQQGIATFSIDQPLHGLRPGATSDGTNFYNPLNPDALRDNPRQAAADSLTVHHLLRRLRIPPSSVTQAGGSSFTLPNRTIRFDRSRRMFMGHSQGGATGPLFLGVARNVGGAVLSAGGGHLLVNILTREAEFFSGQKLRDLVVLLLGAPIDLFHPALHFLQAGSEVSDPLVYAPHFGSGRFGRPLNVLFTHGLLDGFVTTPMTTAMVVAAGYPLIAPLADAPPFPLLPGYSYQEAFDLAGLPTLLPPVSGNLGAGRRLRTGGLTHYAGEGHFPVFNDPAAIFQWTEFLRTLVEDDTATIPSPVP